MVNLLLIHMSFMAFKKILVPYDNSVNSKRALNKAFELASIAGSTVIIVNVIAYHNAMAKIVEPYKETIIGHVKKFLDEAKKDAIKKNIKTEEIFFYGNPSEEIMNLMKKKKFDLVVMGRRGTTKLTGPSLGSVSNALVQHSKIPVMVVE